MALRATSFLNVMLREQQSGSRFRSGQQKGTVCTTRGPAYGTHSLHITHARGFLSLKGLFAHLNTRAKKKIPLR